MWLLDLVAFGKNREKTCVADRRLLAASFDLLRQYRRGNRRPGEQPCTVGARPQGDEPATSPNGPQDANPPTSVIGVDRVGQAEALREHGASIVVPYLSELLEER